MAKDDPEIARPDWKQKDMERRPSPVTQMHWDTFTTTPARLDVRHPFCYVDRVGPEMFVARYNHGKCNALPEDINKTADWLETTKWYIRALENHNHAYILTITPNGAESICLYCGITMEGVPYGYAELDDIIWDEYDKPRRATKRELESMNIPPPPDHGLLYLDENDDMTYTGRFRIGECLDGGMHEVVLCWWRYNTDPMLSYCAFCGAEWVGPPVEYWPLVQPHIKLEEILERHKDLVAKGVR